MPQRPGRSIAKTVLASVVLGVLLYLFAPVPDAWLQLDGITRLAWMFGVVVVGVTAAARKLKHQAESGGNDPAAAAEGESDDDGD